jgi:hypothetical protein
MASDPVPLKTLITNEVEPFMQAARLGKYRGNVDMHVEIRNIVSPLIHVCGCEV